MTPGLDQGAAAAKDVLPLVSQYGLASALLVVSALFGGTLWLMGRQLLKLSDQLATMVRVNDVQAKVLEGMAKHLERMPTITTWLAVVLDRMRIQLPPDGGGGQG